MPREASRITLEITGVKAERVQSITEADAIAEGFESQTVRYWQGFTRREDGSRGMVEGGASPDGPPPPWMENPELQTLSLGTAREGFESLWRRLNGKRAGCSWVENPWVFVVAFRRVES